MSGPCARTASALDAGLYRRAVAGRVRVVRNRDHDQAFAERLVGGVALRDSLGGLGVVLALLERDHGAPARVVDPDLVAGAAALVLRVEARVLEAREHGVERRRVGRGLGLGLGAGLRAGLGHGRGGRAVVVTTAAYGDGEGECQGRRDRLEPCSGVAHGAGPYSGPDAIVDRVAARTDIFDLGRLGLRSGEGRRLELIVPVEPLEFGGQTLPRRGRRGRRRARRVAHHGHGLFAAAALRRAPLTGPACAASRTPARRDRGRLARGGPARRGRRGPQLALPRGRRARRAAPGPATRWCSRCPPRSSAARTAGACAPICGENLNTPSPATSTRPSPTRAGPSSRELEARLRAAGPASTAAAMAVPKQRQSHSRTNKRRSQHKISRAGTARAARSAARRGCRTASARTAAPTPAARSSPRRTPDADDE